MKEKKIANFCKFFAGLMLSTVAVIPASAERLFSENFDYEVGSKMYNQGGWLRYGTYALGGMKCVDENFTYPGYQNATEGKAVKLGGNVNGMGEALFAKIVDSPAKAVKGTVYYSVLFRVDKAHTKATTGHFIGLVQKEESFVTNRGQGTNVTARLGISKGSEESKFKFGMAKNSYATMDVSDTEYDLGTTYLAVVKYVPVEGEHNDVLTLYINPSSTDVEPSNPVLMVDGNDGMEYADPVQAVTLAQETVPVMTVDAVRVSTTYADLFDNAVSGVESIRSDIFAGTPSVEVYDLTGSLVLKVCSVNSRGKLLDKLPKGIYVVRLKSAKGSQVIKISKQ